MTPQVPDQREPLGGSAREALRSLVRAAGFDRVGFAHARVAPHAKEFRRWVSDGFAGTMAYLERRTTRRTDPREVLEGARTVIALAIEYRDDSPYSIDALADGTAHIAAYARGTDYHRVVERRLRAACEALHERYSARFRYYVDTGPVLERDWAAAAGIGWLGKNTCSIHPQFGSFSFLAAVLTDLEVEPDRPAADHCGTCRLCIDACPTDAIVEPYRLDARRCISYLTIELRGEIPPSLEPDVADMVFGCDICQEVCPHNRRDELRGDDELAPRRDNLRPQLSDLLALDEEGFRARFPRSAVRRAKFRGFLRNVMVAIGNVGTLAQGTMLEARARKADVRDDSVLNETAQRALRRLAERHGSAADGFGGRS